MESPEPYGRESLEEQYGRESPELSFQHRKECPQSLAQASVSSEEALMKRIMELEADHALLRAQIAKLLMPAQPPSECETCSPLSKDSSLDEILPRTPSNNSNSNKDMDNSPWDEDTSQRITSLLTPSQLNLKDVMDYDGNTGPITKHISERHLLQSIGHAVYIFGLSAEVIYW
jgi:hypothetical protein